MILTFWFLIASNLLPMDAILFPGLRRPGKRIASIGGKMFQIMLVDRKIVFTLFQLTACTNESMWKLWWNRLTSSSTASATCCTTSRTLCCRLKGSVVTRRRTPSGTFPRLNARHKSICSGASRRTSQTKS